MKRIKAVIFDLDGTIGNTIPLCIEAFKKSIEPLTGKTLSDEKIIATFGPSEEGTIKLLAPEQYDRGISDYLHYYKVLHEKNPEPFYGTVELLGYLKLKGVRIAMVTGKGEHSTKITLERYGINHFFEKIETGHSAGPGKPEGLISVMNYFGNIANNEAIYIGDAPSDITACKQVGISIIAAAWADTAEPEKLKELNPDQLFNNINDLKNWLLPRI